MVTNRLLTVKKLILTALAAPLIGLWLYSAHQTDPYVGLALANGYAQPSPTPTVTPTPIRLTPTPIVIVLTPTPAPTQPPSELPGTADYQALVAAGSQALLALGLVWGGSRINRWLNR